MGRTELLGTLLIVTIDKTRETYNDAIIVFGVAMTIVVAKLPKFGSFSLKSSTDVTASGNCKCFSNDDLQPFYSQDFNGQRLKGPNNGIKIQLDLSQTVRKCSFAIHFDRLVLGANEIILDVSSGTLAAQNYSTNLIAQNHITHGHLMERLYHDDDGKDLELCCQGRSVWTHFCIIRALCENMLPPDAAPGSTVDLSNQNTNFTFEGVEAFVKFVYGQLGSEEFFRNRRDLFRLAHTYNVAILIPIAAEAYFLDLSRSTVLDQLSYAVRHNLDVERDRCVSFLRWKLYDDLDLSLVGNLEPDITLHMKLLFGRDKEVSRKFGWD